MPKTHLNELKFSHYLYKDFSYHYRNVDNMCMQHSIKINIRLDIDLSNSLFIIEKSYLLEQKDLNL